MDLEDQGDLADYLGINFAYQFDGSIIMSQLQLIAQIIRDVNLKPNSHLPPTPTSTTSILQRELHAEPFSTKHAWHYRSIIGKLNYLEKGTRADITYATHQCARFCEDPRNSHGRDVEHLVKYLMKTKNKGIILKPDRTKSLEVFADADFSGNWNITTAADDASTAKSRTGYIILYAGCPIVWQSKLQTQCALSTTEAEYISLSQSLRTVIPIINLIEEMKSNNISTISTAPTVFCKAFEDNSGALELAKSPKLTPRTKHINITYHHFREAVRLRIIQLFPISTVNQLEDIYTKPLPRDLFVKFRKIIMGW